MTGDFAHLHPRFRAIASEPDERRIDWIQQDRWINYTRAEEALKRFDCLLQVPVRNRMPCLLLTGAPGMGKTHIVQQFMRSHGGTMDCLGRSFSDVASMQMPPEPMERDFYEEFLFSIGSVVTAVSVNALRTRARTLSIQMGIRLLIIDEIHSILAGTFRQQRTFLNSLRFLANDLHLPIVCVGTLEAQQALMTDVQLADRFEAFELPPWKDDGAFGQLLSTFECILPLRKPSNLRQARVRQRILALTDGITVRICRLLEAATASAIRAGKETVDLDTLADELASRSVVSISQRKSRRVTV